jgi:hypothetical protein
LALVGPPSLECTSQISLHLWAQQFVELGNAIAR